MSRRLRLTAAALLVPVLAGAGTGTAGRAAAAQPAPGGQGADGEDFSSTSELLGDGADVEVVRTVTLEPVRTGGDGRPDQYVDTSGAGAGGGGGPSPLVCRYTPTRNAAPAGTTEMVRVCDELAGVYSGETVLVPDTAPAPEPDLPAPVAVDPVVVAEIARDDLRFPAPVPRTSPSIEDGTYAQFPTAFWVEGWAPVSTSATVGPVTATVTATPLRQDWRIRDAQRGGTETVSCAGAGRAPGPESATVSAPGAAPACEWTPRHSSAGQRSRAGGGGEACFAATVTVTWGVAWTSTLAPGGELGTGTSSTDVCLVVAELQAVVEAPA